MRTSYTAGVCVSNPMNPRRNRRYRARKSQRVLTTIRTEARRRAAQSATINYVTHGYKPMAYLIDYPYSYAYALEALCKEYDPDNVHLHRIHGVGYE